MKNETKMPKKAASKNDMKTAETEMNTNKKNAPEGLHKFFVDGLKDIYWAEKALTKALPKMIKNATSSELSEALTNHLEETKGQVTRLEEVFASIDQKAVAKKCDAMEGLIKEAQGIMEETDKGSMRDAGIIAAGQKVEHYEIATYGTLAKYAGLLGLTEAQSLLHESLEEEKAADEKLTEVTEAAVMAMDMVA
jgi:ferritin-like metal-binding protein YciE